MAGAGSSGGRANQLDDSHRILLVRGFLVAVPARRGAAWSVCHKADRACPRPPSGAYAPRLSRQPARRSALVCVGGLGLSRDRAGQMNRGSAAAFVFEENPMPMQIRAVVV